MNILNWKSCARHVVRLLFSDSSQRLMEGFLLGTSLLVGFHLLIAHVGTSTALVGGFCFALLAGLVAGSRLNGRLHREWGIGYLLLSTWVFTLPWLAELPLTVAGALSSDALQHGLVQWGITFASGLIVVGWAGLALAWIVGREQTTLAEKSSLPLDWDQKLIGGFVAGLLLTSLCLAPLWGTHVASALAVVGWCALFLRRLLRPSQAADESSVSSPQATESPVIAVVTSLASNRASWTDRSIDCGMSLLVGSTAALAMREVFQLMLTAPFLVDVFWAVLLIGFIVGRWSASDTRLTRRFSSTIRRTGCVAGMCCTLALIAAFPELVRLSLSINSQVQSLWQIVLCRVAILAVVALPLGWGWGTRFPTVVPAGQTSHGASQRSNISVTIGLVFAWTGYWLARFFLLTQQHIAGWHLLLVTVCAVLTLLQVLQTVRRQQSAWKPLFAGALCCATLIGSVALWGMRYNPALSTKLLFSTQVSMAAHNDCEFELLPYLDDARLLESREGEQGTLTAWRQHGAQLQIRDNGIPLALSSTNPQFFPEFSGELLHAAFPLTLHERPRRVLLLGLGGGVPLKTCLAYPVQEVRCVEPNKALTHLVEKLLFPYWGQSLVRDNRLELVGLETTLALLTDDRQYDVILSSALPPVSWQAVPELTVEQLHRIAARLDKDGIFCQRFPFVDFGAQPLQEMARTMQAAFKNVGAFEVGPGELLFLGTNSPKGLIRDNLLTRLQTPHVRRILSSVGWDWSVLLNLPAYQDEALTKIAEDQHALLNSSRNGLFAFQLPPEVMRWGTKQMEVRQMLDRHTERILAWLGEEGESPVVLRRLAEVASQSKLMAKYPDQYWAYRKEVKKQITERPASLIQQVGHDPSTDGIHPEDRRRMQYFEALSDAKKQKPVQLESIDKIERFSRPYDPLLSYFLRGELAVLYEDAETSRPRDELRNLLYVIYYGRADDRSVRCVISALDLLMNTPSAVSDDSVRSDLVNSLLQALKRRWDARGQQQPAASQVVLNDIELSLEVIDESFAFLAEQSKQGNFSPVAYQARERVLQRELVRPLRTYRARLLPHHYQSLEKSRRLLESLKEDDESLDDSTSLQ